MQNKITDTQKLLLDLTAKALFDKNVDLPDDYNCEELIEESKRQTVFTGIYSFVKDKTQETDNKLFSQTLAKNIRVEFAHNEVHKALTDCKIPYVILKGVSSASHYKEPMLRMMGDVDILVSPNNIINTDLALKSIGFTTNEALDKDGHIAYKRRDGVVCEVHRDINGIPQNDAGDKIHEYLADVLENAREYKTSNGVCIVPSEFHHGVVLLLHTAIHLTNEGVGLRHLCDWAVFVDRFSSEEFKALFEKPLKEMGLWRFAGLLTLCCAKYVGCKAKEWAGKVDDTLLESMISDILNGGNFGYKDRERYSHIKYISDREKTSTSKKSPLSQLVSSINSKTKQEFKFAKKYKVLLPIGWIFTVCKYFYLVVVGKRKIDTISTINGAKQRKEIYNEFKLFENDL